MKAKSTVSFTLREVPKALDEALRRKSQREGKSINQTLIEVLQNGLALSQGTVRHRDLDFMIGSWVEDPAFDEAIRAQDQVP